VTAQGRHVARGQPRFEFGRFAFGRFAFTPRGCFDSGTFAFVTFGCFHLGSFFRRLLGVGLGDFTFPLFDGFFRRLPCTFFPTRCDFRRVSTRTRAPDKQ